MNDEFVLTAFKSAYQFFLDESLGPNKRGYVKIWHYLQVWWQIFFREIGSFLKSFFCMCYLGIKYTGKLLVKFNYSRNILILLNFSTQQNSSVPGGDKYLQ